MADLEAEIAGGTIAPVYVLFGEDPFLVDRVVGALREAAVPPALRAFNLDVFEAKSAGAAAILGAARTLPMMGTRRLVIARDVETLGAEGLEPLGAYLAKPSPTTVLVLLCAKTDGRLKFFQAAKKKGFLHELSPPRQIVAWIQEEARRRAARLEPDAARRLADVAGRDLGRLVSALDQLVLYVDPGRPITTDDVDELVAETRERTVFELANAVGSGNREAALHAVRRLFDQRESAIGVAMMLARHYRQLALAREHLAQGASVRDLPGLLRVPPFAVDGLVAQARRIGAGAVARAFALLAQADRDLKGPVKGALGERIVVERLVGALLEGAVATSSSPARRP